MLSKIRTSYFGRAKIFDHNKFCLIGIAGKSPDGWTGFEYKKLAPSWSIYKEWYDARQKSLDPDNDFPAINENYTRRFVAERLTPLDANLVISDIEKMANGKIPVLLCYENPGSFCHRHLVAKWLRDNFPGLDVAESF